MSPTNGMLLFQITFQGVFTPNLEGLWNLIVILDPTVQGLPNSNNEWFEVLYLFSANVNA